MKTIALANQKGGVGKTTTAASLGVGLAQQGKKVLLVDADAQGNLTQMLGWRQPDELSPTLADLMTKTVNEEPLAPGEGILHHASGVDLVPANIELSGLEVTLVNIMSRETVLRQYLSTVAPAYDYAIIDCMPSLGMLTINALTAADSVIIPVQGQYLAAKGLEQLMRTIARVKRQINPHLTVDGILLTMMDSRTTLAILPPMCWWPRKRILKQKIARSSADASPPATTTPSLSATASSRRYPSASSGSGLFWSSRWMRSSWAFRRQKMPIRRTSPSSRWKRPARACRISWTS